MVVMTHASNVLGTVQPVSEVGRICAERGVSLVVDVAQSAGTVPIDMTGWNVTALAFTGHKALLGPTGTGGLVLHPDVEIRSTRFGGTGIDSRSLIHTQDFPHRLEAGTLNLFGILGLSKGIDFIEKQGLDAIHERETALLSSFHSGLEGLDGVEIYNSGDLKNRVGILTLNVMGMDPEDLGAILDADFDIAVRVGLHCAPLVHETLGTYPRGAVRFSLGPFNTPDDIDHAVEAMREIAKMH